MLMAPKATILSVDDDPAIQMVVEEYLQGDGYRVIKAHSGKELYAVLESTAFDVVLLDLVLPDAEGLSLIAAIRQKSKKPIIIVSGKSDTTEKIVGLEMGADDYLTKPYEMRELSARIKAVLRRGQPVGAADSQNNEAQKNILFDGWCLDRSRYQLFDPQNHSVDLTTGEFKLLEALVSSPNRTLSREHLFDLTRDGKFDVYDRAIDIQIARIRKKLGDDPKTPALIKTVRGVGYMFCGQTSVAA